MSLKKSILKIFSVNMLSMLTGIIVSFVVPAILSIEGYAELKTFNFYLTYTAFLSLGFVDGMYIKYGGKEVDEIDKVEFKAEHNIFIVMQGIFTIVIFIIGLSQKNNILLLVAMSVIPSAMFGFFTMFYQAIGEFNKYSKIILGSTILTLIFNLLLAVIIRSDNYLLYCFIPIIINTLLLIYLEIKFTKKYKGIKVKYKKNIWKNIKIGFFILLGNLSVILFYGIDRWFIKIFYSTNDFAYYSFAVSMLGLINLLINAVSVTMYNYISKGEKKEDIKEIKDILLMIGVFASLSYFIFAGIVEIFLSKYIPALSIIAISFAAYPYMITINAIFVNLYKARKQEKKYFKVVISMLLIAIVYNGMAIIISNKIETIALATTLGFITWYIYSTKDFEYLKLNLKEIIFLSINTIAFLYLSNNFNWAIGGIIYLIIILISIWIMFDEIIKGYIVKIKSIIQGRKVYEEKN